MELAIDFIPGYCFSNKAHREHLSKKTGGALSVVYFIR